MFIIVSRLFAMALYKTIITSSYAWAFIIRIHKEETTFLCSSEVIKESRLQIESYVGVSSTSETDKTMRQL